MRLSAGQANLKKTRAVENPMAVQLNSVSVPISPFGIWRLIRERPPRSIAFIELSHLYDDLLALEWLPSNLSQSHARLG